MSKLHRSAVWGLLWLAFSTASSATTLQITNHGSNENVNGGGEFQAVLNPGTQNAMNLNVFCVDYLNFIGSIPDNISVNVDVLPNISDTRYGKITTESTFSFYKGQNGDPDAGGALQRYELAGYLVTQYNFTTPTPSNQDYLIQDAIWNLLDINNVDHTDAAHGVTDAALKNLITNSLAALPNFHATVTVYTDTQVNARYNNCDSRYVCGQQEYISVSSTAPEPAGLALVGGGLLMLGFFRRRK